MRRFKINILRSSIAFPIFLGLISLFCLWFFLKPFTTSYFLFAFLFWTAVNLYGLNSLPLKRLKFKLTIFSLITLLLFCVLFQRIYNALFLKSFSLTFYTFIIIVIFYMKSPKKFIKVFLLSQQFLFFIVLTISLANIETHFLEKGEASLGSRYLHAGLACFISCSYLYYIEKVGLNGQIYKTRLILIPLGIMASSYGIFLILTDYGANSFGLFVGVLGGLAVPLGLLFLLRKKYSRYG